MHTENLTTKLLYYDTYANDCKRSLKITPLMKRCSMKPNNFAKALPKSDHNSSLGYYGLIIIIIMYTKP